MGRAASHRPEIALKTWQRMTIDHVIPGRWYSAAMVNA